MPERRPHLISRLQGLGTTIFTEMTALAVAHDAVNLGQGYPDVEGPAEIRDAAIAAMRAGHNQYAPGTGVPALRQAIVAHQRRSNDHAIDAENDDTLTAGATDAKAPKKLTLSELAHNIYIIDTYNHSNSTKKPNTT
ncbi:MAG: aminotransferase, partial [Actinobacteria bacterium]|nr:aminotransferase [Actinomycetota bacterium]